MRTTKILKYSNKEVTGRTQITMKSGMSGREGREQRPFFPKVLVMKKQRK